MNLAAELSKIQNSVKTLAATEVAFTNFLVLMLSKKNQQYDSQIMEFAFEKLRQRNFDIVRKVMMHDSKLLVLFQKAETLEHLSLILKQHHLYFQVNTFDYGPKIFKEISNKIKQLLTVSTPQYLLFTQTLDDFSKIKKAEKQVSKYTKITQQEYIRLNNSIFLLIQFIFNPLLQFYCKELSESETQNYSIIVKWLVIISDHTNIQRSKLIFDFSKRILSNLCPTISIVNNTLSYCFNTLLNYCTIAYHPADYFQVSRNLFFIINYLTKDTLRELSLGWYKQAESTKVVFENVFHNLLASTVHFNSLKIIEYISIQLAREEKFQILFYLNEKVIKKKLVECKYLKEEQFRIAIHILMFYTIGFINMDRIDQEIQRLIVNYKPTLLKSSVNDIFKSHSYFLKFLYVCEDRFKNLTKISRNLIKQFQKIYKFKVDFAEVYQLIRTKMFNIKANQQEEHDFDVKISKRYLGFTNIGNTCYMNSFIQALYMTKSFKKLIEDLSCDQQSTRPSTLLNQLFGELSEKGFSRQQSIKPYKFKKHLIEPFSKTTEQQDSAEFGRLYLSSLLQDLKQTHYEELLQNLLFNSTTLCMTCKDCKTVTRNEQKVLDFILSFQQSGSRELISNLLKKYFKDGGDQEYDLFCEKCQKTKKKVAKRMPKYFSNCMILTLNRFFYSREKKQRQKLFNQVEFEFEIDLKLIVPSLNFTKSNTIYELYAFIVHLGSNAEGGHYVAYARNIEENPNLWYTFDDAYVTEKQIYNFDDFNLGANETPYVLFYSSQSGQKIEVPDYTKIKIINK